MENNSSESRWAEGKREGKTTGESREEGRMEREKEESTAYVNYGELGRFGFLKPLLTLEGLVLSRVAARIYRGAPIAAAWLLIFSFC
jgi:hypothetical protein